MMILIKITLLIIGHTIVFNVSPAMSYENLGEVYNALVSRQVKGVLVDTFSVGARKDLFDDEKIRISKILDYSYAFGVVLAGEATKLQPCLKRYVTYERARIFDIVNSNIRSIKVKSTVLYYKIRQR